MSLRIASLNSGSNGNCYYIGNDRDAILVDAGLSCRETEKRMAKLGLSLKQVRAVFISHEHGDHIRGLDVLSRKHRLPVFISQATLNHSRLRLDPLLLCPFRAGTPVSLGGLTVHSFLKAHDAADPCSFMIESEGLRVGVFTDIGTVCDPLRAHFAQCHAAFLEANYDAHMLQNGRYPHHLKNRIRGGKGHLSNTEAYTLFRSHRPDFMSHLFLSHLSADNNDPDLARELFLKDAGSVQIIVASRYRETALYTLQEHLTPPVQTARAATAAQLALF